MKSFGDHLVMDIRPGNHYHEDAIRLNTGRCCFEYILKAKQYKKIYIPYCVCSCIRETIRACNAEYECYFLNELLEPVQEYKLFPGEAFFYVNWFGVTPATTKLVEIYGSQLIVDNTLAFYEKPLQGIDTFYTARKFFGVADGAYLYTDTLLQEELEQDYSYEYMLFLLKRMDTSIEESREESGVSENRLIGQPIKKMSRLTEKILTGIDYEAIKTKRISNYLYLDAALKHENMLKFDYPKGAVPMRYPFFSDKDQFREKLIQNKIYIRPYFRPPENEWCNQDQLEYKLVQYSVLLPINQRYDVDDMVEMVKIIKSILNISYE